MSARRHPSDIQDSRLLAVLDRYVPPIIARSIVERARREAISGPEVSWTDPNGLLDRISVGVRLFAAPEHVAAILRGITDLAADEQETSPTSGSGEDNGPASTLKPASVRARLEEPRVRMEEQPPTRRDLPLPPPAPPSSPGLGPGSKRSLDLSFGREPTSSRGGADPQRDGPSSRESARNAPPTSPEGAKDASRRDADGSSFATLRNPADPTPNRGVFPSAAARPTPPVAHRVGPLTSRATGRGPAIEGIPAIPPPPPPPGNLRDPKTTAPPAPARPTPPAPGHASTLGSTAQSPRANIGHFQRTNVPTRGPTATREIDAREITITLATEHDIPRARQVAREICEALGTRALTQQRLVTIVSELGRNMVLYAGGGKITLRPPTGASRRVTVLAVDQGPGISNLSEIMAGRYKSRSGLGLGIVGTKRLADGFHIDTGRHGTAVSVEVIV